MVPLMRGISLGDVFVSDSSSSSFIFLVCISCGDRINRGSSSVGIMRNGNLIRFEIKSESILQFEFSRADTGADY